MTAPDPAAMQAALAAAAATIERRQFITDEIARLQAEGDSIDAQIADSWAAQIAAVTADLQTYVEQLSS